MKVRLLGARMLGEDRMLARSTLRLAVAALLAMLLMACRPIATFTATPGNVQVGVEVVLDGTGSMAARTPPGNRIVSYLWNLGDGTTASGQTVNHTYLRAGRYIVRLRVTDSAGRVDEMMQPLQVHRGGETAGPVSPIPQGLWRPTEGTVPAQGNYIHLSSEIGDWIGASQTHNYTSANAMVSVQESNGRLSVSIDGQERWSGDFQLMSGLSEFEPGFYPDLNMFPDHLAEHGGLYWRGQGRTCESVNGWFAVDHAEHANGQLVAIELRFEQRCNSSPWSALRGQVRWISSDAAPRTEPLNPPPASLWRPDTIDVPFSGNYVYLDSQPGDPIGQGGRFTFTQSNSTLSVGATAGRLDIGVSGAVSWSGHFRTMNTIDTLQPGYYPDLTRFPFHVPSVGGMDWYTSTRACSQLTGWFVVDEVSYDYGELSSIKLRFEQRCASSPDAALRGQISWAATPQPGPTFPVPQGLWAPDANVLPETGTYVYLASDAGDLIGQGGTYLFTPETHPIHVSVDQANFLVRNTLEVRVGEIGFFGGHFQPMETLDQIEVGYYRNLTRWSFHNRAVGGLSWTGPGRGCNTLSGWVVVDHVAYTNGALSEIEYRFVQQCDGGHPALRGKVHWRP